MILITSASYVSAELALEFGSIPPSFLPLGCKRLYEYQANLFNAQKQKIVITLPYSFDIRHCDITKIKSLNMEILAVPDNLNLAQSIIYALNMNMPLNEELEILHGDTYFKSLKRLENSISVTKNFSNYNWSFLDDDFNLQENYLDCEKLVLSGYFNIKNPYEFIRCITKAQYNFINGLKLYSLTNPLKAILNDSWLDFGLVCNYFHSKKAITTQRNFNDLKISQNFVLKTSTMPNKLDAEINWFLNFPKELILNIPRFINQPNNLSYKTEYIYHNTLAELFVFGKLPLFVWTKIFTSIKNFLTKLHNVKTNDKNLNFDYKFKTLKRLEIFSKQNNIDLNTPWVFNGQTYPCLNKIINELDLYINANNDEFCFIHGDFCFSNIMYDFKANDIKVFDPRGLDFANKITTFGKAQYDYAKLAHSCLGLYDFIISGFYECDIKDYNINFTIDINQNIKDIQSEFIKILVFNQKEIFSIMIHLFLSMLPLHNDNLTKQNAILANVFRLYEIFKTIK